MTIKQQYQQQALAEYARKGVHFTAAIAIQDLAMAGIESTAKTQISTIQTLGPIFTQELQSSRGRLLERTRRVAEVAQAAVVNSYISSRSESGSKAGYRKNAPGVYRRDSGGKLLKAIQSPKFMTITPDGVLLGNKAWLDSQARQWYKLNYGVQPAAGRRPGVFSMNMFGANVGALSLASNVPVKWMNMPSGIFSKGGEFTPYKYAKRNNKDNTASKRARSGSGGFIIRSNASTQYVKAMRTKGISAWNYMDPGLRVLSKELPKAWELHYKEVLDTSVGRARIQAQVQANRGVTARTAKNRVNRAAEDISRNLKRQR